MKTCKDCLHFDKCKKIGIFNIETLSICEDFADHSEWLHLPAVAMVEQFIKEGKFDCRRTAHNGRMAVEIIGKIAELPVIKAAPEGTWIDVMENYEVARCSRCGDEFDAIVPAEKASREWWEVFCNEYRYCPSCGARMKKE